MLNLIKIDDRWSVANYRGAEISLNYFLGSYILTNSFIKIFGILERNRILRLKAIHIQYLSINLTKPFSCNFADLFFSNSTPIGRM